MNILIVGSGVWGNALGSVLRENQHTVSFWDKVPRDVTEEGVVLAMPVAAMRSVLQSLKLPEGTILINTSKGIEASTHKLPFEIVQELLGSKVLYYCLMGPSFAGEVTQKMPTLVNLGFFKKELSDTVKNLFQTDYFRVRIASGVEAIELAGACKNVYAIACGFSQGLGFGVNTRSKLITLAIEEMYALCNALHFTVDSNATAGMIGDLILSCTSSNSRNFTFGNLLVSYSVEESLAKINATVEGYTTTASIPFFKEKTGLPLPLASLVYEIVYRDGKNLKSRFEEFVKKV